jgi:hypothetical protein
VLGWEQCEVATAFFCKRKGSCVKYQAKDMQNIAELINIKRPPARHAAFDQF